MCWKRKKAGPGRETHELRGKGGRGSGGDGSVGGREREGDGSKCGSRQGGGVGLRSREAAHARLKRASYVACARMARDRFPRGTRDWHRPFLLFFVDVLGLKTAPEMKLLTSALLSAVSVGTCSILLALVKLRSGDVQPVKELTGLAPFSNPPPVLLLVINGGREQKSFPPHTKGHNPASSNRLTHVSLP